MRMKEVNDKKKLKFHAFEGKKHTVNAFVIKNRPRKWNIKRFVNEIRNFYVHNHSNGYNFVKMK